MEVLLFPYNIILGRFPCQHTELMHTPSKSHNPEQFGLVPHDLSQKICSSLGHGYIALCYHL